MSHTFRITWINWKWRLRIITCHLRKLIAWAHNTNNCVLSWQITAEFMIKLKKTTLKVSDVCLKQHLGLHLSMLPCLTQILTRLRKPDLLWGDDEDCHDDIYTGYPKKCTFWIAILQNRVWGYVAFQWKATWCKFNQNQLCSIWSSGGWVEWGTIWL